MEHLRQLFKFYINSSIHVAFAVCALVLLTNKYFDLPFQSNLLFFIFFASITGYNFVKYFGMAKFHHRSLAPKLKQIQLFSFLCFLGLLYFMFQLPERTIMYLAGLGVVTFLYAIPFLPKRFFTSGMKNLRAISGLKIYVIAFVWSITVVFIPIVNAEAQINHDMIIYGLQIFLYVLVAILPFEIRDLQYDSLKLSTIPQQIGIKKTKLLGVILLVFFFFLEFLKDEITIGRVIIILVITLVLLWSLLYSKVQQSEYYSAFFVESIPIIWLLLSLIGSY